MASYCGSWSDAYTSSPIDRLCFLRSHPFVPGALEHLVSVPDESMYVTGLSRSTWPASEPAYGVSGDHVLALDDAQAPCQLDQASHIDIIQKLDQVSAWYGCDKSKVVKPPTHALARMVLLSHLLLIWHQCVANSSLTCVLDFIQRHMAPELQEDPKTDPIVPQVVYKVDIRMSYETWKDWNAILEKFGCATDRSFAEGYAQFIKWLDVSDTDIPLEHQQAHGALIYKVVSIGRNLEDLLGKLIRAHSPSWTT